MESNYKKKKHVSLRFESAGVSEFEGKKTYAKVLEQVLGLVVDIQLASLGEVKSRDLRNELILALTLLFLKLEGDTTDGSTLNTLHQMGGVAGNLFDFRC